MLYHISLFGNWETCDEQIDPKYVKSHNCMCLQNSQNIGYKNQYAKL